MKQILSASIAIALLGVSCASAASRTWSGAAGDGLWSSAGNWNGGVPTSADTAWIHNNGNATISAGVAASAVTVRVGTGGTGTGSLTLDGGTLVFSDAASELQIAPGVVSNTINGASTVSLLNGSSVSGNLLALSRGPSSNYSNSSGLVNYIPLEGWFVVDKTSSASFTVGEVGRRMGVGYIVLEGDATQGAILHFGRLWLGNQLGTSTITIGTNAVLSVGTTSTLASTASIAVNGGKLLLGTENSGATIFSTATVSAQGGTISVGNQLTVTASQFTLNNSTFSATSVSILTSSAFVATGSTLSFAELSTLSTVSINVTNSAVSFATTSTLSNGTLSMANSTLNASGLSLLGSNVIAATNSSLAIASASTLTVSLNNSTIASSGVLQHGTALSNWTGSTLTLAGLEVSNSNSKITLSSSVVTLTAASTAAMSSTNSTGHIYLTNGSSLTANANSGLLVARLFVGAAGATSTFASSTDMYITRELTIGNTGSSGVVTVSGGTITMRPDVAGVTMTVSVGNGGSGQLYMSGTGIIAGVGVTNVTNHGTFSGNVLVGTLPGSLPSSYVSTQTLSAQSGAHFLGSINVAADGNVKLSLSGAASSLAAISAQNVSFDSASVVTVDFANLTLSGDAQLTLLLADTLSGLNLASIVTQNLDSAYQVTYSEQTIGAQTALIASLTTIPEPAVAAVLMGLLGLVAVARRRR